MSVKDHIRCNILESYLESYFRVKGGDALVVLKDASGYIFQGIVLLVIFLFILFEDCYLFLIFSC